MATAKDIAQKLGISVSTVSIALNNRPGISEETRKRIQETAEELGYKKRAWNGRKMPAIQLLIYLDQYNVDIFVENPFFSRVIEGISNRCQELEYSLQIAYLRASDVASPAAVISPDCSGLLVLASSMPDEYVQSILSTSTPVVFIDNPLRRFYTNSVSIDNEFAIERVVDYLVGLGHRDIGFVNVFLSIANMHLRQKGFLHAVQEHFPDQVAEAAPVIALNNATGAAAVAEMKDALRSLPSMPTAFVCANDWGAATCIYALEALGYHVPQDVSVTGFDNIPLSEMIHPGITTVDIPKASIGTLAVNRLAELMQENCRAVHIQVLSNLVPRGSTAPCRCQSS